MVAIRKNGQWQGGGTLDASMVSVDQSSFSVLQGTQTQEAFDSVDDLLTSDYAATVIHGSDSNVARPTGVTGPVLWLGEVQPLNRALNDVWVNPDEDIAFQIDGGLPDSVYGGTTSVDGGTP